MTVETLEKQPFEQFPITFDYSRNMATGETCASLEVIVSDKDGNDVSTTLVDDATISLSGQTASVRVRAGSVAASPYYISGRTVTNLTNKWEIDVKLTVREKGKSPV